MRITPSAARRWRIAILGASYVAMAALVLWVVG